MKLEVLKENLKNALSACDRIIRKNLSLPALQNILLTAKGNFLELTTTNIESTIKWWVLSKTEQEGSILVPGSIFSNFISLIGSEKINLTTENDSLKITTENQTAKINSQNIDEFPVIPKIEKKEPIQVQADLLYKGLSQVVEFSSISQVRPEISGIYISLEKDMIKMVATDSFRLGERKNKIEKPFRKKQSFIIPQQAVRELLNIISQKNSLPVNIYTQDNQVLFEVNMDTIDHPEVNFITRLIDGEYPKYQDVIPKKYKTRIQIDKNKLQSRIKEAGIFSGKVLEVKIKADSQANKVEISSEAADIGKNISYIDARVEGESVVVSFNYKFLLDGLNSIMSSEVFFELNGQEGPGVLKPVGDIYYTYILMPIKSP